jgi:hypothetical protein
MNDLELLQSMYLQDPWNHGSELNTYHDEIYRVILDFMWFGMHVSLLSIPAYGKNLIDTYAHLKGHV